MLLYILKLVFYCYSVHRMPVLIQLAVSLARSDWQGLDPILLKAVLKFARTISGVPCVMIPGMLLMLVWPADNWDSPDTVSDIFAFFSGHHGYGRCDFPNYQCRT